MLLGEFDEHERHTLCEEKVGNTFENEGEAYGDDEKRPIDVHVVVIAGMPVCVHRDRL